MEINEVLALVDKNIAKINNDLGFNKKINGDNFTCYTSKNGAYRVRYEADKNLMFVEITNDYQGEDTMYKVASKSLFDIEKADDRDIKSVSNEAIDEIQIAFGKNKKVDLDKVKMPKSISKTKAKSGALSYDVNSLANKFGVLFPECKDDIKANMVKYGEFLPETFFHDIGTPKVLEVIKNGTKEERSKLFKMLNEIYEDGTNEVQDIIGVSILGEMKNDKDMMEVAKSYMSDYMAGPVIEINKVTGKNGRLTKRLANPPAYKPKKKSNFMSNALDSQQGNY